MRPRKPVSFCLHHADRPASQRGLCPSCAAGAGKLVHNGETTWTELEKLGVCLPSTQRRLSLIAEVLEQRRKAAKQ